jgi:hypothetical protein
MVKKERGNLINYGTKSQKVVMITLFTLGHLALLFTLIMTVHYLQAPEYYTDTNISERLVHFASIGLIFLLSFYILYKKWKLKWDWINFLPELFPG